MCVCPVGAHISWQGSVLERLQRRRGRSLYLVEDERLADAAPAADGTQVMDQQQQQQHEGDTGRRVDGVDQEHHHGAADDSQNTRVPGEIPERRPAERRREGFGVDQSLGIIQTVS